MLPCGPDGWAHDKRFITAVLDSKDEPPVTEILNWVWQLWVSGRIPDTIGEHLFCLAPRSQNATWIGVGAVTVTGWMASSPGVVKHGLLRDAHIAATFDEIKGPLTLEPVNSETALADIIKKQRNSLVMRVRVPRIVSAVGYWPPTVEAMNKAKALVDAGKPVRFEDMEGTNIMDAWRFKTG